MSPNAIFWIFFAYHTASYLWDIYVAMRQFCLLVRTTPDRVAGILTEAEFNNARLVNLVQMCFFFLIHTACQAISSAVLIFNGLPWSWKVSVGVARFLWPASGEIFQSLVFIGLTSIVIMSPLLLVICLRSIFGWNEEFTNYYNNNQRLSTYKKYIKMTALIFAASAVIAAALIWIVQNGGPYFFVYAWCFLSLIGFLLMMLYPEFIAPLFDLYTPLPPSALRTRIERLARRVGFPLEHLCVLVEPEGSKQWFSPVNAYMYGFWKNKRIVISEALLSGESMQTEAVVEPEQMGGDEHEQEGEDQKRRLRLSDDEVVAAIAHELGHWSRSHTVWLLIIAEVNLLLSFALFALCYKNPVIYAAFGFLAADSGDQQPILMGLQIVFWYVMAPYNKLMSVVMKWLSRRMESSADEYAARLGYSRPLQSGLVKLATASFLLPVDDWLYSFVHNSHPPVPERIEALRKHQ